MKRLIAAVVAGTAWLAAPAMAEGPGVKIGVLTCNVDSGWGFVFGSSKDLKCTYTAARGAVAELYGGTISKFGIDLGYTAGSVIVWGVFAPAIDVAPGALQGDYAGATVSAAVVGGVGANVLVGRLNNSITLQPHCQPKARRLFDDRKGATMKTCALALIVLLASAAAEAQGPKYPPLSEYLMESAAEIALARSAAPDNVSGPATVKILTPRGFKVAVEGQNGFVCLVLRGWGAPTYSPPPLRDYVYVGDLRAPICFDAISARTMMPYYELRHELGMAGKGPDEITRGVEVAYAKGELPRIDTASIAYMFSSDMYLGPHLGHGLIYPHLMLFLPYYDNAKLGGNERRSGLPFMSDDAGTPFAVTIVPMDKAFAIRATVK